MEDATRKRIFAAAGLALMAVVFAFVLLLGRAERRSDRCKALDIVVADTTAQRFVTVESVGTMLDAYGRIRGQKLDSLDLGAIERHLDQGVGILKSEVWLTPDGVFHARIAQRTPVARFMGDDGCDYYADAEGCIIPPGGNAVRVQVIDGALPFRPAKDFYGFPEEGPGKEWLGKMLAVVDRIGRNGKWSQNIAQIHVDAKTGELVLILRDSPERFLFGAPEDCDAKLARMDEYFKKIAPQGKTYRTVDVRFKGLIYCQEEKK